MPNSSSNCNTSLLLEVIDGNDVSLKGYGRTQGISQQEHKKRRKGPRTGVARACLVARGGRAKSLPGRASRLSLARLGGNECLRVKPVQLALFWT